jgi:hypothetical protein
MEINFQKSSICFNGLSLEEEQRVVSNFPFDVIVFQGGFKIKPNDNGKMIVVGCWKE